MSKKAPKTPRLFTVIHTEEELAGAINRHVELKLQLQKKTAAHERRVAEANTEFDKDTAELVAEIGALESGAQLFAEQHRELFPESAKDGPRSRTYRNATIGFRWNPYRVTKRLAKDTFEAIAERLAALPWGGQFVRRPAPEVDKDALLRHQAELTEQQLAQAGLKFERGEKFFIDPAFDSIDDTRKEAA